MTVLVSIAQFLKVINTFIISVLLFIIIVNVVTIKSKAVTLNYIIES